MRILHVANFNTSRYGSDMYTTDRKITNGLILNGHFVYNFSYRDVCRNESLLKTTKLGVGKVNRKLQIACANIRPHLLLLGHSELILGSTLADLKGQYPEMKIGLWYVDALFHEQKMGHVFERLPAIDVFFATTGGDYLRKYIGANSSAAYFPNIVDPSIESYTAFNNRSYEYDLIFCGRDSNDAERQEMMENLRRQASSFLRCEFRGCLGNPPITGHQYLSFLGRAKMGLNISRRNDVELYTSDRIAQLLGNGLLTFCPRVPQMEKLFADNCLVYFSTLDELVEKAAYFHKNNEECRKKAMNGWRKIHESYNSRRVTRYMLELLFDQPYSENYEWLWSVYPQNSPQRVSSQEN